MFNEERNAFECFPLLWFHVGVVCAPVFSSLFIGRLGKTTNSSLQVSWEYCSGSVRAVSVKVPYFVGWLHERLKPKPFHNLLQSTLLILSIRMFVQWLVACVLFWDWKRCGGDWGFGGSFLTFSWGCDKVRASDAKLGESLNEVKDRTEPPFERS